MSVITFAAPQKDFDPITAPFKDRRTTGENAETSSRSSSILMGRTPMGTPSEILAQYGVPMGPIPDAKPGARTLWDKEGVLMDNPLTAPANPISVLVVDGDPLVLISIARILDANGMRALLARNGSEALEIAGREYIPIDLMLTNAAVLELRELNLQGRLSEIRPGVPHLCMATSIDCGAARIQLMMGGPGVEPVVYDGGLVESIMRVISAPLVRRAGRPN